MSARLLFNTDIEGITIEELKELKMKVGWEKHGDPMDVEFADMFFRFLRYYGEFLVALHIRDFQGQLEGLADIANGCELLFPLIQNMYSQKKELEKSGKIDEQEMVKDVRHDRTDPESSRFE